MSFKKRLFAMMLVGSFASTSAFANNNNTGVITVQGVVPGNWELTVYDINNGYDFDLTATGVDTARVGTIHVYTNSATTTTVIGHLRVESANAGRLINNQSIPGIASDNQDYTLSLVANALASESDLTTASTLTGHSLQVPATFDFTTTGTSTETDGLEATYDVEITLDAARANASGVYTDTITFTIMDDG